MNSFFNKYLAPHKRMIIVIFTFTILLLLLSSCSLFNYGNSKNPLASTIEPTYIFYELYDQNGTICDTIFANNATDAIKSVTLEKFIHNFSENNYPIKEASNSIPKSNDIVSIQMHAFNKDNNYDTYVFDLDFERQLFQLTKDASILLYSTDSFDELFKSDLLEYFFPKSKLPDIHMSYNNQRLDAHVSATWNHHIYHTYYATDIINNDFITTPDFNSHEITSNQELIHIQLNNTPDENRIPNARYTFYDASNNFIEEKQLIFDGNQALISAPPNNGKYELVIEYNWPKQSENDYGSITQTVLLDVELPATYSLNASNYEPGDLLVVNGSHLNKESLYSFETDIYHESLEWIHHEDGSYLLLPLMSRLSPGEYAITIYEENNSQLIQSSELVINVIDKEFPVQHLKTSSSTASIRSNENQIALNEAFSRGRENLHTQPLWSGAFLQPVGGRISTEYGVIRYTNDAVESSRHNGIDFAIGTGTPVVATETGYVRLAEHIAITGNTIFIDHGAGIISQYYHLDSMEVNVGDLVEKGDGIGTVGSTGFSTGPHLHFSMFNNGVYVNPWKFFDAPPF